MQFGLFCSPKADSGGLGPETGQGFRDYLDFNVEAEALGFHSSFSVEHHFTGWNQVSATLMLLMALAMRTKTLAARHRGDGAALAQSGAAGRAGGDARSGFRRPVRFRHRQRLPAQRIQGLRHCAGRGRGALRGSDRGHDAGLDHAHALLPSRPLLEFRRHRGRAAAGAEPASAVLGRRRQSAFDQARRRARLQSDPRSIRVAANARRAHRDLSRPSARRTASPSIRCRSRWRASSMSPRTKPTRKRRWCARPNTPSARSRSRARPTARPARTCWLTPTRPGATEENALYGTPDEIAAHARGAAEHRRRLRPADRSPAARRSCGVSRARSCRPFHGATGGTCRGMK